MTKKKMTVEDLLIINSSSITLKEAAEVLGWGYKTMLEMAKHESFPFENCIVKLGDGKHIVMRVRLITFITGESYEEQIEHKRKLLRERKLDLQNYNDKEKEKINRIINNIQE